MIWSGLAFLLVGCAAVAGAGSAPQEPAPEQGADQAEPKAEEVLPEASSVSTPEIQVELENLGPAPELNNEVWLNTDKPLRLADLRGQVVLLDMWTFG
jgi:hypothetical protein